MYTPRSNYLSRIRALFLERDSGGVIDIVTTESDPKKLKDARTEKILAGIQRANDVSVLARGLAQIDGRAAGPELDKALIYLDATASAPKLPGFPDAKFIENKGGVNVFAQGDDTILSVGNAVQKFPSRIYNDSFISQFAANNGITTPEPTLAQAAPTNGRKVAKVDRRESVQRTTMNTRTADALGADIGAPATQTVVITGKRERSREVGTTPTLPLDQQLTLARSELASAQQRKVLGANNAIYDPAINDAVQKVQALETQIAERNRTESERSRIAGIEAIKGELIPIFDQRHALRVQREMTDNPQEKQGLSRQIARLEAQIRGTAQSKNIPNEVIISLEPKLDLGPINSAKASINSLRSELASNTQQLDSITKSGSNLPNDVVRLKANIARIEGEMKQRTDIVYAQAGVKPQTKLT